MLRFLGVPAAVLFLGMPAMGCDLSGTQLAQIKAVQSVEVEDICNGIASSLFDISKSCSGTEVEAEASDGDATVKVNWESATNLPEFTINIFGKSDLLTGMGEWGYENQLYKLILFLDLSCTPQYRVYEFEPRYIKADLRIAKDLRNPNWKLFSDPDRQRKLTNKIAAAVISAIRSKLEGQNEQ